MGEKKHKHDFVITNFPLPKSYTSERIIIYLYDKFAWKGRMNFTWTNHMTFTWTVMWVHMTQSLMIKKKKFKFGSQIFDILEKQSIGYCIRLINRTLSVWNMTVKYGERKNTHETGRLTLRQMFSTAWFKNTFNWPAIHCILLKISVVIHAFAVLFKAKKKNLIIKKL